VRGCDALMRQLLAECLAREHCEAAGANLAIRINDYQAAAQ
jgi:hypothetical protein